jgi:hypothetical protein
VYLPPTPAIRQCPKVLSPCRAQLVPSQIQWDGIVEPSHRHFLRADTSNPTSHTVPRHPWNVGSLCRWRWFLSTRRIAGAGKRPRNALAAPPANPNMCVAMRPNLPVLGAGRPAQNVYTASSEYGCLSPASNLAATRPLQRHLRETLVLLDFDHLLILLHRHHSP